MNLDECMMNISNYIKIVYFVRFAHLCTERQVISQVLHYILQQINEALVEGVLLALHVHVLMWLAQDVEQMCEVTLPQLDVIHSLKQGITNGADDKQG